MDDTTRRHTALDMAMRWNAMNGISCPGCLVKQASQFDEFLRTGGVVGVEHLAPELDEEVQSANIIPLSPKGRPN